MLAFGSRTGTRTRTSRAAVQASPGINGLFQLEGNTAQAPISPPLSPVWGPDDWNNVYGFTGAIPTTPPFVTTSGLIFDYPSAQNSFAPDRVLTGGGTKDIYDLSGPL